MSKWTICAGVLACLAVLVLLPILVATWDPFRGAVSLGAWRWLGLVPFLSGGVLAVWSAGLLVTRGDGTPAPWDPPRRFVLAGPYQVVRHPMMLGAFGVVLGEAVWAESPAVFLYLCGVVSMVGWYTSAIEEKELEARFLDAYRVYRERVPRWLPRLSRKR
ncbi:MAG TPA: isoprenylcysteine carboxylmethyltransferase family protein [Candidatus Methylomirabilis sp.]